MFCSFVPLTSNKLPVSYLPKNIKFHFYELWWKSKGQQREREQKNYLLFITLINRHSIESMYNMEWITNEVSGVVWRQNSTNIKDVSAKICIVLIWDHITTKATTMKRNTHTHTWAMVWMNKKSEYSELTSIEEITGVKS